MQASDVMTRDVVSVSADTPVQAVAKLLLSHGISAVPVTGPDGAPVGMVSEGDLVARDEGSRRDWWLNLVAADTPPEDDFLKKLRAPGRTAGDVMSAPLVAVTEDTGLAEISRLLSQYRIKRVPVVKNGSLVGIVSRADLLRAVAGASNPAGKSETAEHKTGLVETILGIFLSTHHTLPKLPPQDEQTPTLNANTFRNLVEDFHAGESRHHDEVRQAAAAERARQAEHLVDTHLSDDDWKALLHRARQAAAAGEEEFLLLRFPNALCADGGRAINNSEEDWPATLRGEAAEMYLRWQQELKGQGFHLSARVLEFPGGMPGDIGLFLSWVTT